MPALLPDGSTSDLSVSEVISGIPAQTEAGPRQIRDAGDSPRDAGDPGGADDAGDAPEDTGEVRVGGGTADPAPSSGDEEDA
jgi:hypothetical protein